jgi:decaprenyl-phosphate phosphoribosyltransferase
MSGIDPKSTPLARPPLAHAASSLGVLDPPLATGLDSLPSSDGLLTSRDAFSRAEWYGLRPYVQIARVDHWFKNAFMMLGTILALFYQPALFAWSSVSPFIVALVATCLIASSNYVLNEILDGPTDRLHPKKRNRPVPSGRVKLPLAYAEWIALGVAGVALAASVNLYFAGAGLALWILGVTYNVPPVRTKEWPYIDVVSESANNAVRLLLGWFALVTTAVPPVSLALSYWMLGAFFMATKRFAEYRHIGNAAIAGGYRRSFRYYTEERLLVSMFFYATTCALFAGVFIVRYHLELILYVPVAAGVFAYYLSLGLQPDSPTQNPEKLYKQRGFFAYMVVATVLFVVLMFTSIPTLYTWFNVDPSTTTPLWTLGGGR